MKKTLLFVWLLAGLYFSLSAQTSTLGNAGGNPTSYLGWDAATPFPLNIRHNGNQNINIFRNGLNRMQFQTENWTGLNVAF
jgi:hypothetical protein